MLPVARPRRTTARNVNRSIEESLTGLERVLGARPRAEGLRCEGVISVSLRLPLRGPRAARARVRDRAAAGRGGRAGDRLRRHDRDGQPAPGARVLRARRASALGDGVELTAHFHNTRGQGLANVLRRSRPACDSFESSFGELGGCPVPAGRDRQHRHRGPRLDAARDGHRDRDRPRARCSRPPARRSDVLGRPLGSHVLTAGPVDWHASVSRER